jgi:hypothetical protein
VADARLGVLVSGCTRRTNTAYPSSCTVRSLSSSAGPTSSTVASLAPGIAERSPGDWRVVAAAWLAAIMFVLVFTAADALASRHSSPSREPSLAGAQIPRHDPSFPGPDEIAASDWLGRVRAEAYSGL